MPQNDHQAPRRRLKGDFAPNPRAPFVELGVTSAFSFLRGASDATELVQTAHGLGYDAIGIADLNSLAGVVRLHAEARRAALRPIIGARIVLTCGTGFLAYPRDRVAYGRLSTLISKGRMRDPEGRWQKKGICDLTLDDLADHAEGLALIWLPDRDLSVLPGLAARQPGWAMSRRRIFIAATTWRGSTGWTGRRRIAGCRSWPRTTFITTPPTAARCRT